MLFLHGAGERGSDGKKQIAVGLAPAIRKREATFPFIVVFPQCKAPKNPPTRNWYPEGPDGKRALAMLAETEKTYRTDPDRVYLTGLSMGGFGTWSMAAADPKRWAAIAPVCGGGEEKWGAKLSSMPIWCFHGASDVVVPAGLSRKMIDVVKKAGGDPKYTEYPGVGHNSWDDAYGTNELYDWFLKHQRGENK
jgi:predicted peptidase